MSQVVCRPVQHEPLPAFDELPWGPEREHLPRWTGATAQRVEFEVPEPREAGGWMWDLGEVAEDE